MIEFEVDECGVIRHRGGVMVCSDRYELIGRLARATIGDGVIGSGGGPEPMSRGAWTLKLSKEAHGLWFVIEPSTGRFHGELTSGEALEVVASSILRPTGTKNVPYGLMTYEEHVKAYPWFHKVRVAGRITGPSCCGEFPCECAEMVMI